MDRANTIHFLSLAATICMSSVAFCQEPTGCSLSLLKDCVENDLVRSYMSEVNYREGDYTYTELSRFHSARTIAKSRKDIPDPVVLKWAPDSSGRKHLVSVSDGKGFEKKYALDPDSNELEVYNLIPGRRYEALLLAQSDSLALDTLTRLSFTPKGQVRMINSSVRNVRDLGGWKSVVFKHRNGSPKHICYGRIFRGAELDRACDLTDADREIFLQDLKIGSDLDLRGDKESHRITGSPLGLELDYFRLATSAYTKSATSYTHARDFRWLLHRLREGKNVYLHCAHGADRTGTMCFILEALLGVSEGDIDKDYELTTFYGWRSRKVDDKYDYGNMVISYYEVFNGQNLTECVEEYLRSCGITQNEINEFRSIMLE